MSVCDCVIYLLLLLGGLFVLRVGCVCDLCLARLLVLVLNLLEFVVSCGLVGFDCGLVGYTRSWGFCVALTTAVLCLRGLRHSVLLMLFAYCLVCCLSLVYLLILLACKFDI